MCGRQMAIFTTAKEMQWPNVQAFAHLSADGRAFNMGPWLGNECSFTNGPCKRPLKRQWGFEIHFSNGCIWQITVSKCLLKQVGFMELQPHCKYVIPFVMQLAPKLHMASRADSYTCYLHLHFDAMYSSRFISYEKSRDGGLNPCKKLLYMETFLRLNWRKQTNITPNFLFLIVKPCGQQMMWAMTT